ncbi:MAG TPA: SGNH/GDSL hydrolase family protein [Thermoanaerobaculia bacterium]|nr:SGNH/GDSL hydrolase family protein [Thermoanaerobaculia bacterium]
MKPPPRRAARLILLLVSAGLSLLVAEVALRIAGVGSPIFYHPDPHRGWALRPGAEGWQRHEGEAWVHVNSRGLRDEEHAIPKPPGEVRIAVLGDSCVEAIQVPVEETFWALLEKELAACPAVATPQGKKTVQAVSFGVSGYGTAQELLTLRHEVWDYEPDLVLLAFYSGNDVRNNYRPLEQDPGRPYFTLPETSGSAELALDDSFRETGGYRFRRSLPGRMVYGALDRSRVLQLAKQAKTVVDGWIGAWKAGRQEKGAALQELGLDNAVYQPPATPEWTQAWRVTEAMVRAMRDETAGRGVPFGVVSLTTGMQVHPDPAVLKAFV